MAGIAKRRFRRGGLEVTEIGLGTAPLGGMYRSVSTGDALETIQRAWQLGIRYFDTAPMYGLGRCEHLVGSMLRAEKEREPGADWVLGTKVGRLMRNPRPGAPLPPSAPRNEFDSGWANGLNFTEVFDYSYDGIMRSYEDSQQRLGLDRLDILLVHDIGRATHGATHGKHWGDLTQGGGFRALSELRDGGYAKAIGLGVNEWEVIRDALGEADLDCCLLAGRYTLLDQSSLSTLLPLCVDRGVSVIAAGVFNSGILVSDDLKFNYADAPPAIIDKAQALGRLAGEHGVPLPAAAMRFSLSHPAVATLAIGARTGAEIEQVVGWHRTDIPAAFWQALRNSGLVDAGAPLPGNI